MASLPISNRRTSGRGGRRSQRRPGGNHGMRGSHYTGNHGNHDDSQRTSNNDYKPSPLNFGRGGRRSQGRPGGNHGVRGSRHSINHGNHENSQGTSDSERGHKPSPLNFGKLRRMVACDQTDAVLDMVKHTEQLQNLLDDRNIQDGWVELILEILANIYDTHMKGNLMKIISLFPNTSFLQKALPRYVMQLAISNRNSEKRIQHVILFCDQLLTRFPDMYTDVPLDSLEVATNAMTSVLRPSTLDQVEELMTTRRAIMKGKIKKKPCIIVVEKPPEDFRQLSVHPVTDDFNNKPVFLRKNIVQGQYDSVNHYLDVQFRLLREDFLGPLREGIQEMLDNVGRNERAQNLRVYRDVEIIDIVCTHTGIVNTIRFSLQRLKRVNWENSKRLIFGTFLCLSKDDFNTLAFAVVTERNIEELQKGCLQVRFLGDIPQLQPGDRFQMVESPGYYESYVHNLQGLQELDEEKLPFARYLVQCETTVESPRYLSPNTTYDLGDALGVTVCEAVTVLDTTSWPNIERTQLNSSQMEAVKAALTKEFVVIQGPPGTGKTYVGLRIVQALLDNSALWCANDESQSESLFEHRIAARSPMLVVCYTNHALDQFLEGILQFQTDRIVRVGGRSGSEVVKQHNLSQMTRRTAAWYTLRGQLQLLDEKINGAKKSLALSYTRLLRLDELNTVMEQQVLDQLQPLLPIANYWGTTVIQQWLDMEPLNMYVPNDLTEPSTEHLYDEDSDAGEDDFLDENEDDNNETEKKIEGGEENDGVTQKEDNKKEVDNKNEGATNNEADTVDVETDADVIQRERQLNDDYARIGNTSEETAQIGLTHGYINMVNRNLDEDEQPQYRDQVVLLPGQNVWYFDQITRTVMYKEWVRRYQELATRELTKCTQRYEELCKEFNEIRYGEEERVLREAKVIGMTTTGAAKYRNVLQKVQPKVIVVEEAAEVLEAHIITCLSQRAEHLILIGDHKQLRPNANVFALAKEYNLDVSLFERMVKNGMACHTLDTQHRMRPGISQLMAHIYQDLRDDESVTMFPDIDGISRNIFFIDHQYPEQEYEELRSRSNQHEANYIVALCRYLLLQGYDKSRITVLTTYTGQLLELKRLMPKKEFGGVRLCTVDNFQGEENDIILLSLVRSNSDEKIGFLGTPNRVCVALSRAKMGFYCIGNFSLLARRSDLWAMIKADLEKRHAIGPALPIYCKNHVKMKTYAATANDFKNAPQGGCTLSCDVRLNCGHKCEKRCHPVDIKHVNYVCQKACGKLVCASNHRCKKRCHHGKECGPCQTPVEKQLTRCGHSQMVPCSLDETLYECGKPCERFLPCNHRCRSTCSKECSLSKCQETAEVTLPCGHHQVVKCSTPKDEIICRVPCSRVLDCGHPCRGTCDECSQNKLHVPCQAECGRRLVCSHICKDSCARECQPCEKDCENACLHGKCNKKCGKRCTPCQKPCMWSCKHRKCKLKCFEICTRKPCNTACRKKLKCSKPKNPHKCVGLCGEKCPKLCRYCDKDELTKNFFGTENKEKARFIELIDCGHVFEVTALDEWMAREEADVTNIKLKECPKCKIPIRKSQRYGNVIKKVLQDIEAVKLKVMEKSTSRCTQGPAIAQTFSPNVAPLSYGAHNGNTPTKSSQQAPYSSNCERSADDKEIQMTLLGNINEMKRVYADVMLGDLEKSVGRLMEKIQTWKLTSQVVKELQEEITRATLKCRIRKENECVRRYDEEENDIPKICHTDTTAERGKKLLHRGRVLLARRFNACSFIPKVEQKVIAKVVGFSQNDWFKCSNGHVFAFEQNNSEMKCPECGEL